MCPHTDPNQHQKLNTSTGSPLKHSYHVWSTSVSAFVSYPAHRQTDRQTNRQTERENERSHYTLAWRSNKHYDLSNVMKNSLPQVSKIMNIFDNRVVWFSNQSFWSFKRYQQPYSYKSRSHPVLVDTFEQLQKICTLRPTILRKKFDMHLRMCFIK